MEVIDAILFLRLAKMQAAIYVNIFIDFLTDIASDLSETADSLSMKSIFSCYVQLSEGIFVKFLLKRSFLEFSLRFVLLYLAFDIKKRKWQQNVILLYSLCENQQIHEIKTYKLYFYYN